MVANAAGETVLREERKKRHLTQGELASRAGIKLNYLKKIEAGQAYPGGPARERIRQVLGFCQVCADFGKGPHRLPVPKDEELYRKIPPLSAVADDA